MLRLRSAGRSLRVSKRSAGPLAAVAAVALIVVAVSWAASSVQPTLVQTIGFGTRTATASPIASRHEATVQQIGDAA